jgi:hypothetical protein
LIGGTNIGYFIRVSWCEGLHRDVDCELW